VLVGLPYGSIKVVKIVGNIIMHSHVVLKEVLLVLEFRFNLLSVGTLLDTSSLHILFTKTRCLFQALITKAYAAAGNKVAGLYKFPRDAIVETTKLPEAVAKN